MTATEKEEMKQVILEKIEDTEQEIEQLKELTKPIQPDAAYGRLSRMDAINNKTINDAALREQRAVSKNCSGLWKNWKRVTTELVLNVETLYPLAVLSLCPGLQNV